MESLLQFRFPDFFSLFLHEPFFTVFLSCPTSFFEGGTKGVSIADDFSLNACKSILELGFFKLALPEYDNEPAFGFKLPPRLLITFFVAGDFSGPIISISLWNAIITATVMAMPEAPVDEDDRAVFGQDYIRRAWQVMDISSVSETVFPKIMPSFNFRCSIRRANLRHTRTTLLFCELISHTVLIIMVYGADETLPDNNILIFKRACL